MTENSVEILLVEDNPNDEMLALHAFKKHNLANKVHVVRDGAEALQFLFCTGVYAERVFENPRLILLDKKLPLVDGIEVLREIRADPRTRLIPVIMLTFVGGRPRHDRVLPVTRQQLYRQTDGLRAIQRNRPAAGLLLAAH